MKKSCIKGLVQSVHKHRPLLAWKTRRHQQWGQTSGCPIGPLSSLPDAAPAWTWAQGSSWEGAWPGWKVVAGTVRFYPGNKYTGNIFDLQEDEDIVEKTLTEKWKGGARLLLLYFLFVSLTYFCFLFVSLSFCLFPLFLLPVCVPLLVFLPVCAPAPISSTWLPSMWIICLRFRWSSDSFLPRSLFVPRHSGVWLTCFLLLLRTFFSRCFLWENIKLLRLHAGLGFWVLTYIILNKHQHIDLKKTWRRKTCRWVRVSGKN